MKRNWLCMLMAGLLAACGLPPGAATPTQGDAVPLEDGAVIVFKREGGIAGVSEAWRVYPDGRVMADGAQPNHVAPEEVALLLSEIEALGFFKMNSAYGQSSQCADCFYYTLTVAVGEKTKTVETVDAASDAPPELQQVLEKVSAWLSGVAPN